MSSIQSIYRYNERNGFIPRQKSCRACARAKRRCDLALPVCSRCKQRHLDCEYPLLQAGSSTRSQLDDQTSDGTFPLTHPQSTSFPGSGTHGPLIRSQQCTIYGFDNIVFTEPPKYSPLPPLVASRIQFSFSKLQDAATMMVLENQTPWCHRLLYQAHLPRCMQGTIVSPLSCLL